MSENKVFNFGQVNDEDSSLQTKKGGKFGLNTNCKFSLIDFTDKAGKDETEGNAVCRNNRRQAFIRIPGSRGF